MVIISYFISICCAEVWSTQTKSSKCDCEKHTGFPSHPL